MPNPSNSDAGNSDAGNSDAHIDRHMLPEHIRKLCVWSDALFTHVYWPEDCGGCYTPNNLRQIANYLDDLNKSDKMPNEMGG